MGSPGMVQEASHAHIRQQLRKLRAEQEQQMSREISRKFFAEDKRGPMTRKVPKLPARIAH